jgi:hypothetical protein
MAIRYSAVVAIATGYDLGTSSAALRTKNLGLIVPRHPNIGSFVERQRPLPFVAPRRRVRGESVLVNVIAQQAASDDMGWAAADVLRHEPQRAVGSGDHSLRCPRLGEVVRPPVGRRPSCERELHELRFIRRSRRTVGIPHVRRLLEVRRSFSRSWVQDSRSRKRIRRRKAVSTVK